jgi:hypothetical protein
MKIKKHGFEGIERPLQQKIHIDIETEAGPLNLCVDPLSLGFYDTLRKNFPEPMPPRIGWLRGKNGKFERDEMGKIIPEVDESDQKYLEDKGLWSRRQNTAILYELLKTDPDIEFTTQPGDTPTLMMDGIYAELLSSGMSEGQQFQIISALNKASGIDQAVEEAKKN